MDFLNKKVKIIFTGIIALLLFLIGVIIIKSNKIEDEHFEAYVIDENNETSRTEETKIKVHITGETIKNGIIEINEGARISDVIDAAGGSTEEADLNRINLAYKVEDGQKIYIPNINDKNEETEYITDESGDGVVMSEENKNKKININKATQTELETLSGIGPSTALKIINYREQNGKFSTIEDLKNVSGIGEAKYNVIKDSICVQ